MPGDRLIPTPVAPTVATFTVLSDGTEVSREHQILSLVIDKSVNRIPAATLVIRDGDAANQTFAVSETDLFIPGKEIEIKAGYQGTEDTVFKGMVISQSLKVRGARASLAGSPALQITRADAVIADLRRLHDLRAGVEVHGLAGPRGDQCGGVDEWVSRVGAHRLRRHHAADSNSVKTSQ